MAPWGTSKTAKYRRSDDTSNLEEIRRNASEISPQRPRCDSYAEGTVTYTAKTKDTVKDLYKKINIVLESLRTVLGGDDGSYRGGSSGGGKQRKAVAFRLRESATKAFVTQSFARRLQTKMYTPIVESIFDDLAWLSKYGCKVDTLAKNMVEDLVRQVMIYSSESKQISTQRIESGGEKGKSSKTAKINIPVTTAISKIIVSLAAQGKLATSKTRYRT